MLYWNWSKCHPSMREMVATNFSRIDLVNRNWSHVRKRSPRNLDSTISVTNIVKRWMVWWVHFDHFAASTKRPHVVNNGRFTTFAAWRLPTANSVTQKALNCFELWHSELFWSKQIYHLNSPTPRAFGENFLTVFYSRDHWTFGICLIRPNYLFSLDLDSSSIGRFSVGVKCHISRSVSRKWSRTIFRNRYRTKIQK